MGRTSRLAVTTSLLVLGVGIWRASRFSAGTAVESEGQRIFRFDTFGDEQFWTDTAKREQAAHPLDVPSRPLRVALKVDADAIPPQVAQAIKAGQVDLNSPATTVTLLKLNAVVGRSEERRVG